MKRFFILIIVCAFFVQSCEEHLLTPEFQNSPVGNFEAFWSEFDVAYGAMQVKKLNWDSLKVVYGNTIHSGSSSIELYNSLCGLLNVINDGHASLYAPEFGRYRSWNRRDKSYYADYNTQNPDEVETHRSIIRETYLANQFKSREVDGNLFFYGTINEQNATIGYLCIPTFNLNVFPGSFIRSAVDSFQTLDAVIIDLRFNGGGTTESFVYTLNTFASESKVFMKSNYKIGPAHDDFSDLFVHQIRPHSTYLNDKPVAILMNSVTASSSEHFIIGMKSQSRVITVGDTTCGAFSSVNEKLLPNGWKFRLGGQVVYTPDGNLMVDAHGNYLEGIGIAPDYFMADQREPLNLGMDLVLDKAIEEILKN